MSDDRCYECGQEWGSEDKFQLRLLQGMVAGALLKAGALPAAQSVQVEVDKHGDYTGRVLIDVPSGRYALTLVPEDQDS